MFKQIAVLLITAGAVVAAPDPEDFYAHAEVQRTSPMAFVLQPEGQPVLAAL